MPKQVQNAFNNHIEFGLRALIILKNTFPNTCDIDRLSILDYMIVHSGDFNEKLISLHAPIPNRSNEIYVRRIAMSKGLELLNQYGLVTPTLDEDGVSYVISDEGEPFLDMLREPYGNHLQKRAEWVIKKYSNYDNSYLTAIIRTSVNGNIREVVNNNQLQRD
ncbi:ABC-three component system middle component 2 [Vibrio splendidus]|uniref:ABC-three component system middle component 2 n=1 Tax=Vibrio splendidus TaxID=29497 RepID=UPI0011B23688|nr:ABC-three component system middle component 2 [Vibrio splendidus]